MAKWSMRVVEFIDHTAVLWLVIEYDIQYQLGIVETPGIDELTSEQLDFTAVADDLVAMGAQDDAIQSAHVGGHVSEPHKAAILGALQITDDLFRSQASEKALARSVVERIGALRQTAAAAIKGGE